MTRYLDSISHPWSRLDIQTAIFRNFSDARSAIEGTDGGRLWRSLMELDDSIYIFESNISDLLDEISLFADRSKSPAFWYQGDGDKAENHTREIKRKLFNCTAALMTLVDHRRKFSDVSPVPDYDIELRRHFQPLGLHDFLQGLRNYNTHWRIAQANWIISYDAEKKSRQARFIVAKAELLAWDKWKKTAKLYINSIAGDVDLYEVFSTYREHALKFHTWHRGAVLRHYNVTLRQYLEYKHLYEGISKKCHWNMTISRLPKTLNPLQFLFQYLPLHSVERVLALPHQSKQQADEVIRSLNMDEFCDSELRNKVYTLFGATS